MIIYNLRYIPFRKGFIQKEKYSESIEQRIDYRELDASVASGHAKTPGMVKI